jgi:hypothetical protein
MESNIIIVATAVIALSAIANTILALCIRSSNNKFQEVIKKLLRGVVVSNLINPEYEITSAKGERAIKIFNELHEKGEAGTIRLHFP